MKNVKVRQLYALQPARCSLPRPAAEVVEEEKTVMMKNTTLQYKVLKYFISLPRHWMTVK
jgi:hypothetical protein